jgi:hypothetical protein
MINITRLQLSTKKYSTRCFARVALASCADALTKAPEAHTEMLSLMKSLKYFHVDSKVEDWQCRDVNWTSYDAVILCQTWDYSSNLNHFIRWLQDIQPQTRLYNPHDVIKWNINKSYLRDLQSLGIKILPTYFVDNIMWKDHANVLESMRQLGWDRVVIKPGIGCDSEGIGLYPLLSEESVDHINRLFISGQSIVLAQPYLKSVQSLGEVSLIYIDNVYSHAVQKFPISGEYRVQERFGGSYRKYTPSASLKAQGDDVMVALSQERGSRDTRLLYARVDFMHVDNNDIDPDVTDSGKDKQWAVGEVELVEPFLYLGLGQGLPGSLSAFDRLAMAICQRVANDMAGSEDVPLYAIIRVDTHGNRFVVRDRIQGKDAAAGLLSHLDLLTHHQGYYVVTQDQIKEELQRPQ